MKGFVDITREAEEAGFDCRVMVTAEVWDRCCEWTPEDTERQDLQDKDARIWDIVFVPSMKLRMGVTDGRNGPLDLSGIRYQIYCLLRGEGTEATLITLRIQTVTFAHGERGMVISFEDEPL